ncbi:MAG: DUF1841 family protein [Mariprofundaceae bacterium]|nr:DUF1841 family protein [Mariprofundaceae bacterium]
MAEARKGPDREQLRTHRQVFWDAWQKSRADLPLNALEVRIVRVIHLHPEYHAMFDDMETFLDRDFQVDDGMNPYLHLSLHLALEEQIAIHQPQDVCTCLEFLMQRKGMDRHDALHALLDVLAETVYFAQRKGGEPDITSYVARVRELMRP